MEGGPAQLDAFDYKPQTGSTKHPGSGYASAFLPPIYEGTLIGVNPERCSCRTAAVPAAHGVGSR